MEKIYFGGGTPAILNCAQIDRIFKLLFKNFDFSKCKQITFEGNPNFLDKEKLALLKKSGVNRLTIGVQSLNGTVIKKTNRFQTEEAFIYSYNNARKLGIRFINIDLMAGLPGQSLRDFMQTIGKVVKLKPDMVHIHPFYPTENSLFMQNGGKLTKNNMLIREEMCQKGSMVLRKFGYSNLKFDAMGNNIEARNIQLSDAIEYNSPFLGLGPGEGSCGGQDCGLAWRWVSSTASQCAFSSAARRWCRSRSARHASASRACFCCCSSIWVCSTCTRPSPSCAAPVLQKSATVERGGVTGYRVRQGWGAQATFHFFTKKGWGWI